MRWACSQLADLGVHWSIKRDDLSGAELSGNKVRKLEYLMADALAGGHDCVVTIGGVQSNHCRATAAAARLVGMEPHLVLLVRDKLLDTDPGMEGNLLVDRLLGAKLHLCAAKDYQRYGGNMHAMNHINEVVASELRAQGRRPYVVPVGGTTPMAAWGYIDAVSELREQLGMDELGGVCPFDHIVFPVGSGGTASGIALGCQLSRMSATLHGVNVHHTPDHFYELINTEAAALGHFDGCARDWLQIHHGAGAGYGVSTPALMRVCADTAHESGVLLDHVYSGKCLYHFCEHVRRDPDSYRGAHILFWHTGGTLALYSEQEQLLQLMPEDQVQRLELP